MKLSDRTCALDDGDTMRSLPSRLSGRLLLGRVGWSTGKRMHGDRWPGVGSSMTWASEAERSRSVGECSQG